MPVFLTALLSTIGGFFSGLFSYKNEQAKTVQSALEVLSNINSVDGQQVTAAAQALSAILTQGSWLEKNWRPVFMVVCIVIVISSFFGYTPTHFNDPISPNMERVWRAVEIGLMGYLPLRTVDKLIQQLNIGSILKALINKKVM